MEEAKKLLKRSRLFVKALVLLPVALLLFGWLLNTPPGLLGKADAIGYAVCHRIDGRSFHIGERSTPLCARCSGMYLGAVLGMVYLMLTNPRKGGMPNWRIMVVLAILVVAFAVDGLNSYMHFFPGAPILYEPQNWGRLVTGTGMGLVIALVIYPGFNQTFWKGWDRRPALQSIASFTPLVFLALLLDILILSENPLILYPLALISAGSVILLLTIVYAMMWTIILRLENSYEKINQLGLPFLAGFGMALLQIVILNLVRYWFTGTWGGFQLG